MENSPHSSSTGSPPEKKRNLFTSLIVGGIGALSTVYLLNPTAGFFELIPDNVPVFGNLDEAAAAALLISALAYFGIDLGSLFGKVGRADRAKKGNGEKTTIDAEFVER